jgi:hypothetical protein
MHNKFGLAISSLKNGYAVTCISSEDYDNGTPATSYHSHIDTTNEFLFIAFLGDEDTEDYCFDIVENQLQEYEVTDDIYTADINQIFDLVEELLSDGGAQVVYAEGNLLDELQHDRRDAYAKLLADIRQRDEASKNRLLKTYSPYVNALRDYFLEGSNKSWIKKAIETVYYMDRTSRLEYFSPNYQSVKSWTKIIRSHDFNRSMFPENLNPYALAISAFGYKSENGPIYLGAYSISNSEEDKTKRENWGDADLAVYGALRASGGALEAMAYRYGYPPNPQNHQLRLIPFNDLIPEGVRFYNNIGIERYLKERHPDIPYKEIRTQNPSLDLLAEMGVIKNKYWPQRRVDVVDDLLNI